MLAMFCAAVIKCIKLIADFANEIGAEIYKIKRTKPNVNPSNLTEKNKNLIRI